MLMLVACGGGGGSSEQSSVASEHSALQTTQLSAPLTEASMAANRSIESGLWSGVVQSPEGGEYNLKVLVDDLGGALIELSFISDEKSFELNALKLFGMPDYWGGPQSIAGFDLERQIEKAYWKDINAEITYAAGHVEQENGGLSVSIDLSRAAGLYTLAGFAVREETKPFGDWLASGDAIAANMRFGVAEFNTTDTSFVFVQDNCVVSGTYLTGSAQAPVSRVSMQADCVGMMDESFSGDYVGFAYRATGACSGDPQADVLRFSATHRNGPSKMMPYACW